MNKVGIGDVACCVALELHNKKRVSREGLIKCICETFSVGKRSARKSIDLAIFFRFIVEDKRGIYIK